MTFKVTSSAVALAAVLGVTTPFMTAASAQTVATQPQTLSYKKITIDRESFPEQPGSRISIFSYRPEENYLSDRLVVIMPGRNGRADAGHLKPVIKAYLKRGIAVVSINPGNSRFNDSEGSSRDFTLARHTDDLRRTMLWIEENKGRVGWTGQKLFLAGHSMGAYSVLRMASTLFKNRVDHVLVMNPVTTGKRQLEAHGAAPGGLQSYFKRVRYAADDYPRHDIYPTIQKLTMPVTVVTGEKDKVTLLPPVVHFYNSLPNPAGLTIIPNGHHCLSGDVYLKSLEEGADKAANGRQPFQAYAAHP